MSPTTTADRYRSRIDECEALRSELEGQPRPGGLAPVIERLLEAAGDLLRRTRAVPCERQLIERALAAVSEVGLASWGRAVDVEAIRGKLARAASQAVEVALPEEGDQGSFSGWVMQDLRVRDRFESVLVALEALASQGRGDARVLWERLSAAVAPIDLSCRRAVASLTAVNEPRRAEWTLLDPPHRGRAWWYAERAGPEDDALVRVLGGEAVGTLGRAERSAHQLVTRPRRRRVSSDELFRFDLGTASPAEAAAIRATAQRDQELRRTLLALEEGEKAIEALEESPVVFAPRSGSGPAARAESGPEVALEREEFRVLVFRTPQRVQVVLQPHRLDRMAAAAVWLADEPQRAFQARPGATGFTVDLGPPGSVSGKTARLQVTLADGMTVTEEVVL